LIDLFVRSRTVIYANVTANRRYDAVQFTFSETVRGSDPYDIAVVLGLLVMHSRRVNWSLVASVIALAKRSWLSCVPTYAEA